MFRLHDNTRRRICHVAFLVVCVLPTLGVSAWCVRRHLPGTASAEARRIADALGLDVSLDGLQYLRPGRMLCEGLELADPETGQTLLRCRVLQADRRRSTDRQGWPRESLVLTASQPEIEASTIGRLTELLDRTLRRQIRGPEIDVRLMAGELTLRSDDGSQTVIGLEGSIESTPTGTEAAVCFRLPGTKTPEPIRVRVLRNRQTIPPSDRLELDTGGGAVPCDLLAVGMPTLGPLGPRSRFRGCLWASRSAEHGTSGGWDAEVTGQLLDVDLDDLVTDRFPHKLSGTARVTIQSARFRHRRLEEAAGTLVAGPGVISRSLIDAAVDHLGLVRGTWLQTPGSLVPYGQLALGFQVDRRGLHLQGMCPLPQAGAILAGDQGRLLDQPVMQPQPVVALLPTLVPASEVQVPATRETDWLIGHLPIPRVVPPAGAQAEPLEARLRLPQQ